MNNSTIRLQFVHTNPVRLPNGETSKYETIPYNKEKLAQDPKGHLNEIMAPFSNQSGSFDIQATFELPDDITSQAESALRSQAVEKITTLRDHIEWTGNVQDRISTVPDTGKRLLSVSTRNENRSISLDDMLSAFGL